MKERFIKFVFWIFVVVIIFVAVNIVKNQTKNREKSNDIPEEKNYITELKIGISALDTFDPILSTNKNVQDVCKLIYQPLFTIDENYKSKAVLCTEWAETMENSYIIKLKQNVKWDNGDEFTANDVVYTIDKIKNSNNSIYKDNVKNISQVFAIDTSTIKIQTYERKAFFEYDLIFPIEHDGKENIGTGLYKVLKKNNNRIDLVKNDYNENSKSARINTIIIKCYETMNEVYNELKIGNINLINTNNIEYSKYIGSLGYTEKSFKGRNFTFLAFNLANPVLDKIEVRKAISYAIDKNAIVSSIYNSKYSVSDFPLDYGIWLYSDDNSSSGYNPEQSKRILIENGWEYKDGVWKKGDLVIEFTLIVNYNNEYRLKVGELIKKQLENIGIKVTYKGYDTINNYIDNRDYDIAIVEMKSSVIPDLSYLFGKDNILSYYNEEIVNINEEIKGISDENLLKDKYNRILEIYKNDVPFISLFFNNSFLIYNSKIAGNITPTWFDLFYNIENWSIEE